jgi:prepilin-type N-terminal cleavage/methylation domain-containing protein
MLKNLLSAKKTELYMLNKSKKAFTLLELIVVLVVLGILAALAIPSFAKVQKNAAATVAASTAKSIARDANALGAQNIGSSAGTTMAANVDTAYGEVVAPSNATIANPSSGTVTVTVTGGGEAQLCTVSITSGLASSNGTTASGQVC